MKKLISCLLMLSFVLVNVVPVRAAIIPKGFKSWTQLSTTDTQKVWTVKFSKPIDSNSLYNSNIYMINDNNQKVNIKLTQSTDGTAVQVSAVKPYVVGAKYWLFITEGITSNGGKQKLSQPIVVPFTVTGQGANEQITSNGPIISVVDDYSSLITSFTVVTLPNVFSVSINNKKMLYKGNNTYSLGVTGLKQGQTVTVNAYDSKGVLLQSLRHVVK